MQDAINTLHQLTRDVGLTVEESEAVSMGIMCMLEIRNRLSNSKGTMFDEP